MALRGKSDVLLWSGSRASHAREISDKKLRLLRRRVYRPNRGHQGHHPKHPQRTTLRDMQKNCVFTGKPIEVQALRRCSVPFTSGGRDCSAFCSPCGNFVISCPRRNALFCRADSDQTPRCLWPRRGIHQTMAVGVDLSASTIYIRGLLSELP